MKINAACVQMEPVLGDFNSNLEKICMLIHQVMNEKPQTELIVFPELITSGYECGKEFQNLAEMVPDGESMKTIGELAKKHMVHIVYGFPERDSNKEDILYNSAVLIDNMGEVKGIYRKVHLFGKEKEYFKEGNSYPVFDTSIGKLGIMICWDTAFPEAARSLALKGSDLLVVPSSWERPYLSSVETKGQREWDLVTRVRALENCVYLVSANRVGSDTTSEFFGRSNIIGPTGNAMVELLQKSEGVISAELDYSLLNQLRTEYYTFFEDRRPDTYFELTKNT